MDKNVLKSIAQDHVTPFYAYDLEEVKKRYLELIEILPEKSNIYYSLKANPLPALVQYLIDLGAFTEISSIGEANVVRNISNSALTNALYTGPGKSINEINEAINLGVRRFSCESTNEFHRLKKIAQEKKTEIELLFRVNPEKNSRAKLQMSGVGSQFGFEIDDLERLFNSGVLGSYLNVRGIHVYYGTQTHNSEELLNSFDAIIELAKGIVENTDFSISEIDFGGGFPWPYASDETPYKLEHVGKDIARRLSVVKNINVNKIWFESGRYLVASSGVMVAKVIDIKSSKGKQFVVLDAGINHLGGMSGLGRIYNPKLSFNSLTENEEKRMCADVVGPLCTPLDCMMRNADFPELKIDDFVYVPNVGAYGATASLTNFLSRTPAMEITYSNGKVCDIYKLKIGHHREYRSTAIQNFCQQNYGQ